MPRNTSRDGFTLIELLVVVVIIGVLAAIAIPKSSSTKEKAYVASMKADLKNLVGAQEAFFADSNKFASATQLAGRYTLSQGNVIASGDVVGDATGWSAKITNAAVKSVTSCNIYVGDAATSAAAAANKTAATTTNGAPACQ